MRIEWIDKDYRALGEFSRGSITYNGKTYYPSAVSWRGGTTRATTSEVNRMYINKSDPKWQMAFCHELGHVLDGNYQEFRFPAFLISNAHRIREEVRAWRLAKSYCKTKYWSEKNAILYLKLNAEKLGIEINWKKFKIIPLNKGITIDKD